jgi:hypothetical protein
MYLRESVSRLVPGATSIEGASALRHPMQRSSLDDVPSRNDLQNVNEQHSNTRCGDCVEGMKLNEKIPKKHNGERHYPPTLVTKFPTSLSRDFLCGYVS